MRLSIYLIVIVLTLSACATIEEGEIDYARTIVGAADSAVSGSCTDPAYTLSTKVPAGVTRGCYETLYRKYTSVPDIKEGETISVHLMQGFIKGANESRSISEFFQGRSANAEIVVIANVCEQGKLGCSQKFGPEVDKKGRVVFFSNGVKAKQYLNFSYLPVYGPITYEGGPLILLLTIMDFDNLSDQEISMLESLSAAGKKSYPPASGVLSLLDTLGKSLLERNHDDIMFRYSMTLSPSSGNAGYQNPVIAEGNYAFVRKDTVKGYQEQEIWSDIKFDHLSGRLVKKCAPEDKKTTFVDSEGNKTVSYDFNPCSLDLSSGESFRDYRDNTYLTFQVQSGLSEVSLDSLQAVEELLADLNSAKDQDAQFVITAAEQLGAELSRNKNSETLNGLLLELKKAITLPGEDQVDRFSSDVFTFIDRYKRILSKYKAECVTNQTPNLKCDALVSEKQLNDIYFGTRELLSSINPKAAIDTLFPLDIADKGIQNQQDIQNAFVAGYKYNFQRVGFNTYIAEFTEIRTLSDYVDSLLKDDPNKKSLEYKESKKFLESSLSNYLYKTSRELALFKQANCHDSTTPAETCYRYLSKDQFEQILTMLVGYVSDGRYFNPPASLDVQATINSGLAANKIVEILSTLKL